MLERIISKMIGILALVLLVWGDGGCMYTRPMTSPGANALVEAEDKKTK